MRESERMAKERIYELAKELKMPSKDLVNLAKKEGMDVKTHMSSVTSGQAGTKGPRTPVGADEKGSQPSG